MKDGERFPWKTARRFSFFLFSFALFVSFFLYITQRRINYVAIDRHTEWSRYLLDSANFSSFVVYAQAGSRKYQDEVSFVGVNKPISWFEQLDFEFVSEDEVALESLLETGFLNSDTMPEQVVVFSHPLATKSVLYYHPKTGMLIRQR